jgi:hypothetical protein
VSTDFCDIYVNFPVAERPSNFQKTIPGGSPSGPMQNDDPKRQAGGHFAAGGRLRRKQGRI